MLPVLEQTPIHVSPLAITMKRAARMWWSFTWKALLASLLFGFLAGLACGFLFSMLVPLLGLARQDGLTLATSVSSLLGAAGGILISIWFYKLALEKKYRGFKVLLVSTEA